MWVIANRCLYFARRWSYALLAVFNSEYIVLTISFMLTLNLTSLIALNFILPSKPIKPSLTEYLNELSFYLIFLSLIPLSDNSIDVSTKY